MLTVRRCMVTCLIIIVLAVAVAFGVDRFGRGKRVFGPIGTIQAPNIVRKLADNPVDAYRAWKEAGYRGRTIVFAADRWESFDPGELTPVQMYRAYPLQLYNTAKVVEDQLSGVTFMYAAALNGISRRIVAVLPEGEVGRMKAMARQSKDVKVSDTGVFVARQGFPRLFVTGAGFRGANEPVLLYVGASYFKTAEPEELFQQLISAGLQADCVILCRESGKDSVTPREIERLEKFARLMGFPPPIERGGAS